MENEEQKRSRISVINEDILSDKNLNPAEKMVYARICYFEEFFESAAATAEYLGLREWTVQSAKRKLERLGYIKCIRNTGRGKRYVADVNSGIVTGKGRVCQEQDQTLLQTKSDLAVNNIRPCKYQDIGKKEKEKEKENVDKIYTKPKGLVATGSEKQFGNSSINEMYEIWEEKFGYKPSNSPNNRRAVWNMLRAKDKGKEWIMSLLDILVEAQADKYAGAKVSGISDFADLQHNYASVLKWQANRKAQSASDGEEYFIDLNKMV